METSLRYAIHMIMAAQLCSVKRKGTQVRGLSRQGRVVVLVVLVLMNCCCVALAAEREREGCGLARGLRCGSIIELGVLFMPSSRLLFCCAVRSPPPIISIFHVLSLIPVWFAVCDVRARGSSVLVVRYICSW